MIQKSHIKILGIIPARGGSKSIPYKNIANLAGKPLIYYTIEAAKKAALLDAFIVSTDDPKIAEVAKSHGADVPFLRPKKFAQDHSPDIDFLKHALLWLEKHRGWKPEIVLNLRPTSPLRTSKDIDDVIQTMLKTNCDSVRTLSSPSPHNPFKMWHFEQNTGKIKPLLPTKHYAKLGTDVPRQLLPAFYWQNGLNRAFSIASARFASVSSNTLLSRASTSILRFKFSQSTSDTCLGRARLFSFRM